MLKYIIPDLEKTVGEIRKIIADYKKNPELYDGHSIPFGDNNTDGIWFNVITPEFLEEVRKHEEKFKELDDLVKAGVPREVLLGDFDGDHGRESAWAPQSILQWADIIKEYYKNNKKS